MLAHSSARVTRYVVLLALLAAGGLGCQHCEKKRSADCPPKEICDTECLPAKPVKEICPAPECPVPEAKCAPPKPHVEIRQSPPVHVKLPRPQVIVETAAAPVAPAQPMVAAQPIAPVAPQVAAPQVYAPVAATGIHRPINRARLGLTLDFIRLPIPVPRFIAVPTAPEAHVALAPVAPVAPVAPIAYQQPVAPVYAAPAAPIAAYQPVPVAPYAAQPVAPMMAAPAYQPVYQPVAPAPVAPTAPQPASPSTVADFCRQIDALKAALDAQKAALGCDDVKWRSR